LFVGIFEVYLSKTWQHVLNFIEHRRRAAQKSAKAPEILYLYSSRAQEAAMDKNRIVVTEIVDDRTQRRRNKHDNNQQSELLNTTYAYLSSSYFIVGLFLIFMFIGVMMVPREKVKDLIGGSETTPAFSVSGKDFFK